MSYFDEQEGYKSGGDEIKTNVTQDREQEAQQEGKQEKMETTNNMILKSDHSRFVDYAFGNVKLQSLEVAGNLCISGIALGSPIDGGTVTIPTKCAVVILQSTDLFTQLTMVMPLKPEYGQTLTIISIVDIPNLSLTGGTFATGAPTDMLAGVPLKFIFAGQWFNF